MKCKVRDDMIEAQMLNMLTNDLSILVILNEKTKNYKVVDLIESYNFYIKFIFIQVCMKRYNLLRSDLGTPV